MRADISAFRGKRDRTPAEGSQCQELDLSLAWRGSAVVRFMPERWGAVGQARLIIPAKELISRATRRENRGYPRRRCTAWSSGLCSRRTREPLIAASLRLRAKRIKGKPGERAGLKGLTRRVNPMSAVPTFVRSASAPPHHNRCRPSPISPANCDANRCPTRSRFDGYASPASRPRHSHEV
jgi:hypothetical protein